LGSHILEENLNKRYNLNFNGSWPKWKTTLNEDNLNGRQSPLKITLLKDDHKDRLPQLIAGQAESDLGTAQSIFVFILVAFSLWPTKHLVNSSQKEFHI
jgi:hypothetical protein